MNKPIRVGHLYEDGQGSVWRITSTTGQKIAPVEAERWDNNRYATRTYQADGTYGLHEPWDLKERVWTVADLAHDDKRWSIRTLGDAKHIRSKAQLHDYLIDNELYHSEDHMNTAEKALRHKQPFTYAVHPESRKVITVVGRNALNDESKPEALEDAISRNNRFANLPSHTLELLLSPTVDQPGEHTVPWGKKYKQLEPRQYKRLVAKLVRGFHGTTKTFDQFKIGRPTTNSTPLGEVPTTRHGVFFSDSPEFAGQYGSVKEHELNIKNTAKIDRDLILDFAESLDPHGPDRDIWIQAKNTKKPWTLFDGETGKRFVNFLRKRGHDSATFAEDHETPDGRSIEGNTTVVFDPKHIAKLERKIPEGNTDWHMDEDEDEGDPEMYHARHKLSDGSTLHLFAHHDLTHDHVTEYSFHRTEPGKPVNYSDKYKLNNKGQAKEVITHVIDGLKSLIEHANYPKSISYTASSSEPSRIKLYQWLTDRVHLLHPEYTGSVKHSDDGAEFTITRTPKVKLARGLDAAVPAKSSTNNSVRAQLAHRILTEAGLRGRISPAVYIGPDSRASVLQTVHHNNEPDAVRYVASWYGLLAKEPRLTVFHVDGAGQDRLHTITTNQSPDKVQAAARQHGIINLVQSGNRYHVFDDNSQLSPSVQQLARTLNASHTFHTGTGHRIGSGTGSASAARTAYRTIIQQYERQAGADTERPASP